MADLGRGGLPPARPGGAPVARAPHGPPRGRSARTPPPPTARPAQVRRARRGPARRCGAREQRLQRRLVDASVARRRAAPWPGCWPPCPRAPRNGCVPPTATGQEPARDDARGPADHARRRARRRLRLRRARARQTSHSAAPALFAALTAAYTAHRGRRDLLTRTVTDLGATRSRPSRRTTVPARLDTTDRRDAGGAATLERRLRLDLRGPGREHVGRAAALGRRRP